MGRRYFVFAAMVLATLTTGFFGAVAQAQQSNTSTSGNGLRLSPVRYDINVEAGKSQTIEVNVENITDSATELRAIVNDFTAGDDESGKPKVLFDEKDYAPTHGLRRYVAPIENVKLQAKEKKVVKIQISMPSGVAGGGYYGAVRFLPTATNTDKNVSLSASVGSLLLVTVPGDIKEQLGIAGITVNRGNGKASAFFTNGKDLQTNIRFQNSGNVQVSPFGKVSLKKSGTEIASYEVNNTTPRSSALPDSIRRFEIKLGDKAQSFGKYTLEGNFGYGNSGQLLTASSSFYVVPLPFIILGVMLLALVLLLVFVLPKMIKNHDRKLLRKMRKK